SFLRRIAGSDDRLDTIEHTIAEMLDNDLRAYTLAVSALIGDSTHAAVRDDVRRTDFQVNEGERAIRRDLVVHASVAGGLEVPGLLVYMSVVKDIERVGDYAKNLLDLARDGANLGSHDVWRQTFEDVATFIQDTQTVFAKRDVARAREMLISGDVMLDEFDAGVSRLVSGSDDATDGVARALAYRYLKRIVAHLMNVLSSVVMPLDQLDYFDEDPEDRDKNVRAL
ncbi:MAG: PhoU domain-containing protein, partial [Nitriliruptoraceae bacterium]